MHRNYTIDNVKIYCVEIYLLAFYFIKQSGNIPMKVRKVKAPKVDYSESFLLNDPSVMLSARCVRIGCLKGAPVEPVFLSKDGFFMKLECRL